MHPELPRSSPSRRTPLPSDATGLATPIQYIKGVGPKLGALLRSRGLGTVGELLTFFPRAYEDRSVVSSMEGAAEGQTITVTLTVNSARKIPVRGGRRFLFEARCADEGGRAVWLKWFHFPRGLEEKLKAGRKLLATGEVKAYQGRAEIVHPELAWPNEQGELTGAQGAQTDRVVPIYTEIEGISTRVLRRVLWEALERHGPSVPEDLPEALIARHGFPRASQAVREIHFPPERGAESKDAIARLIAFRTRAHERLIYEEFLKFEYLVLRQRLKMERLLAEALDPSASTAAALDLERRLPFSLTSGQRGAIEAILKDLSRSHPMNRLIQGDVGSGKTAVAFLAAGAVLAAGGQAALMAPTEILAEQHHKSAVQLFGGVLRAALVTGRTPQGERDKLARRLLGGEPILVIGTHALIEDWLQFAALNLILIDEQHRFGVDQRRQLRLKGRRPLRDARGSTGSPATAHAHALVLTATPIPRTLALTAYGDLDVTAIKELPPGRSPVRTRVVSGDLARLEAYRFIHGQLEAGRQAYFVFPLIRASESEGFEHLRSAEQEADRLQKDLFPSHRVGLLHGQLAAEEKQTLMAAFKRGEIHVLVSTTVVEVGVDVPNATVMAIEHSERFGLSQLHQLRGRVGRGLHASHCFLFTHDSRPGSAASGGGPGELIRKRLEVLERTQDGFEIAEADLEIRGAGEFLGTRQSGGLPFRMASLVRDQEWLSLAREDALELLREDPELTQAKNWQLRRYYEREGKLQSDRLKTS